MNLRDLLCELLPSEKVKTDLIDLYGYASDASFYHLVPKAVVQPDNEEEIVQLFAFSQKYKIPITFRAGGTSLSGQAVTDGILVDLSRAWRKIECAPTGYTVQVQPGAIGGMVNTQLKKFQRKIGPDPSSINSAMMGGILSNNASGMCCGVAHNSYHTLKTLRLILPNGKIFDTALPDDYLRFEQECPDISIVLIQCRTEIFQNTELLKKIRSKYLTKNTVGYSLNAFVDYEHPLDILAHLMVGGEGTLGFIAGATLHTLPDYPYKATALLYFPSMEEGCKAILPLKDSGAEAIELMDRASLRSIEHIKGVPAFIAALPEKASAILIEYQAASKDQLNKRLLDVQAITRNFPLLQELRFTQDAIEQAFLWKIRKGMFPSVGAVRQQGTTVILEDVAFPLENLAPAVTDLQALFKKYHYDNGIIFGHAKDGNLHFVVTQSFNTPEDIQRYEAFMNDVVHLVVHQYHGALKAEHGTGRNMAPFVETEWGGDAYRIMKTLKSVIDPHNLVNRGVIINEDPKAHLLHLKELPVVESEVDKCIECGFCERNCPSRDLTLTPRRRIIVRRELAKLKAKGKHSEYRRLLTQYQYHGLDTCAVDGLCATDCPVDINTGELVKRLRKEQHGNFSKGLAAFLARNFSLVEFSVRNGIKTGKFLNTVFGKNFMSGTTRISRSISSGIPLWNNALRGARKIKSDRPASSDFVYYTTCITRCMGDPGDLSLSQTIDQVSKRAGISLKILADTGYCCGQPFSSKGYHDAFALSVNRTIEYLWKETLEGKLPVMIDGSSCTYTLLHCEKFLSEENKWRYARLSLLDSVDFATDVLLPKLPITGKKKSIVFHPVCSLTKMGIKNKLEAIGKSCAEQFTLPVHAGCCGMAGDRGFYFPELTASATAEEIREVGENSYDGYYSSGKTCEISLSATSGKNYQSIFFLLEEVSR